MKLRRNPIFWILETVLGSGRILFLILFWLVFVIVSMSMVASRVTSGVAASTSDRKFFHVVAVIVFTAGVVVDRHFMLFASTVVFAIQVLLLTANSDIVRMTKARIFPKIV